MATDLPRLLLILRFGLVYDSSSSAQLGTGGGLMKVTKGKSPGLALHGSRSILAKIDLHISLKSQDIVLSDISLKPNNFSSISSTILFGNLSWLFKPFIGLPQEDPFVMRSLNPCLEISIKSW